MPRKPAATMPSVCPCSTPGFSRNAITTAGNRPSATMLQRKKAIENGGTLPATPRAKIMLETWAVATSRNPSKPSASRALPVTLAGCSCMLEQMHDGVGVVFQQDQLFRVGAIVAVLLQNQVAQRQHAQAH